MRPLSISHFLCLRAFAPGSALVVKELIVFNRNDPPQSVRGKGHKICGRAPGSLLRYEVYMQLQKRIRKNKENKKEDNVSSLVAALLETYRLNDILIAENNDFKNREVHRNEGKILRIDSDSGEIIKF